MKIAKVFITGCIDDYCVDKLKNDLSKAGSYEAIDVYIDSYGGYVGDGKSLLSILLLEQSKGIKINTFGMGQVCSAATFPFIIGEKRTLHPFTDFLAHPPYGMIQGDTRDLEKYTKELKDIEEFIIDLYCKKTSKNYEQVKELMLKNTIITAKEALDFGFATDIYSFENDSITKNSYQKNKPISLYFNMSKKVIEPTTLQKVALNLGATTKTKVHISNAKKHIKKNMLVSTDEGVSLYVYTEDMSLIDKVVVIADAEGSPTDEAAPNGQHKVTMDGKVFEIEVLDGVIISASEEASASAPATEPAEAENKDKEVMDTLEMISNSIKDLVTKVSELQEFKNKLENIKPQAQAQNNVQTNNNGTGFPMPEHLKTRVI